MQRRAVRAEEVTFRAVGIRGRTGRPVDGGSELPRINGRCGTCHKSRFGARANLCVVPSLRGRSLHTHRSIDLIEFGELLKLRAPPNSAKSNAKRFRSRPRRPSPPALQLTTSRRRPSTSSRTLAVSKETGKVLAVAAACLANADGGTLVLGVRDRPGGSGAILGTEHSSDWCRQRVHELTDPSLLVQADSFTFEGHVLVRLDVPRGIDVHEADGRFTRRVGRSCERMSAREIARLSDDRLPSDWSEAVPDDKATDVDPDAMRALRRSLESAERDGVDSSNASDADLLRQLRLVDPASGSLTNAGRLLVGEDDRAWPRVRYVWRETAGAEPVGTPPTVEAPLGSRTGSRAGARRRAPADRAGEPSGRRPATSGRLPDRRRARGAGERAPSPRLPVAGCGARRAFPGEPAHQLARRVSVRHQCREHPHARVGAA